MFHAAGDVFCSNFGSPQPSCRTDFVWYISSCYMNHDMLLGVVGATNEQVEIFLEGAHFPCFFASDTR
jgi:hypothetical protein